jgi:acyl dehydratase
LTGPGFACVGLELRFLKPVFIGDRITVEVTIVGKKEAADCRRSSICGSGKSFFHCTAAQIRANPADGLAY